jgi:hypothetical protein
MIWEDFEPPLYSEDKWSSNRPSVALKQIEKKTFFAFQFHAILAIYSHAQTFFGIHPRRYAYIDNRS